MVLVVLGRTKELVTVWFFVVSGRTIRTITVLIFVGVRALLKTQRPYQVFVKNSQAISLYRRLNASRTQASVRVPSLHAKKVFR